MPGATSLDIPPPRRHAALIIGLRVLIVAIPVVTLLVPYWPPARALVFFAAGRASGCDLQQALRAARQEMSRRSAIKRLAATSRMTAKDGPGFELWQTPHGAFWIQSNTYMTAFFRLLAEDELDFYGAGEMGVQKGDIVLDCGAAHGTYVRTALQAGARLVVAIEPAPSNVACLQRTFAREISQGWVILYPKGVWDKEDSLVLHTIPDDPYDNSLVRLDPKTPGIVVPLTTIDRLVAELKLERVDFIKMDIEGAEQKALLGAAQTIRRYRPRMAISINNLPDDPVKVPELVLPLAPSYRRQCRCNDYGNRIQPAVVNFY